MMARRSVIVSLALLTCFVTVAKTANTENLEGKIYRVSDGEFITSRDLIKALSSTDVMLIGERHGRKQHQSREAFILKALADKKIYPSVVLEMVPEDKSLQIAEFRQTSPEDATLLAGSLKWHETSWPAWSFYRPVFQAAFTAKLPILGGDVADSTQPASPTIKVLEGVKASWSGSLKRAHCNLIKQDRLGKLTQLQIARDQNMAKRLKLANTMNGSPALLIAGSAHTRLDRGVPLYLHNKQIVSVALMEVRKDKKPEEHLPEPVSTGAQVYDYVWFTAGTGKQSVCDRLKTKGLTSE